MYKRGCGVTKATVCVDVLRGAVEVLGLFGRGSWRCGGCEGLCENVRASG